MIKTNETECYVLYNSRKCMTNPGTGNNSNRNLSGFFSTVARHDQKIIGARIKIHIHYTVRVGAFYFRGGAREECISPKFGPGENCCQWYLSRFSYKFVCCCVSAWNLVSNTKRRT